MELTDNEVAFLKETLITVDRELEELERSRDWFASDSREMIESALEILQKE